MTRPSVELSQAFDVCLRLQTQGFIVSPAEGGEEALAWVDIMDLPALSTETPFSLGSGGGFVQ